MFDIRFMNFYHLAIVTPPSAFVSRLSDVFVPTDIVWNEISTDRFVHIPVKNFQLLRFNFIIRALTILDHNKLLDFVKKR